MSTKDPNGKKPKDSYSEQEQWEDDLDLPPIDHKKAQAKKPILEKAEFDKKRNVAHDRPNRKTMQNKKQMTMQMQIQLGAATTTILYPMRLARGNN